MKILMSNNYTACILRFARASFRIYMGQLPYHEGLGNRFKYN